MLRFGPYHPALLPVSDDVDHARRLLKQEEEQHDETKRQAELSEAELREIIEDLEHQDD